MSAQQFFTSTSESAKSNKSFNSTKNLGTRDFLTNCYQQYKKEFTNDEDFSIKSYNDLSQELDDILNEYDYQVKKRHDVINNSIYSDLLEQIGKVVLLILDMDCNANTTYSRSYTNSPSKPSRKFSDIRARPRKVTDLDMKLIDSDNDFGNDSSNNDVEAGGELITLNLIGNNNQVESGDLFHSVDFMLTASEMNTKKEHSKNSSYAELLSQSSVFKETHSRKSVDYIDKGELFESDTDMPRINVIDQSAKRILNTPKECEINSGHITNKSVDMAKISDKPMGRYIFNLAFPKIKVPSFNENIVETPNNNKLADIIIKDLKSRYSDLRTLSKNFSSLNKSISR
jgi:hypothetical protein